MNRRQGFKLCVKSSYVVDLNEIATMNSVVHDSVED